MRDTNARRAAIVIGLFVVLFGVRFVLDDPTYIGATFLLVLPTVLAGLWFGLAGGVAVARRRRWPSSSRSAWIRRRTSRCTRWCGRRSCGSAGSGWGGGSWGGGFRGGAGG